MGDFEDVFGAGANSDEIISGYARDYNRASHVDKATWFGPASPDELEKAFEKDEIENWCNLMTRSGHEHGPILHNYLELSQWEKTNHRPHIRRKTYRGFIVFFTDTKSID